MRHAYATVPALELPVRLAGNGRLPGPMGGGGGTPRQLLFTPRCPLNEHFRRLHNQDQATCQQSHMEMVSYPTEASHFQVFWPWTAAQIILGDVEQPGRHPLDKQCLKVDSAVLFKGPILLTKPRKSRPTVERNCAKCKGYQQCCPCTPPLGWQHISQGAILRHPPALT